MSLEEKVKRSGQKKLLAMDGGGVRSIITIEVLAEIERLVQQAEGRGDDFVLADYFDYIAGTSSGAVIAACLSLGMRVSEVRDCFISLGGVTFDQASIFRRHRYPYDADRMAARLKELFGADTTLGSEKIKTLLLLVVTNAATNTP